MGSYAPYNSKYVTQWVTCADVAQLVARQLAMLKVAGSSPVIRSQTLGEYHALKLKPILAV